MDLSFQLDTCGTCVSELVKELVPLEELAKTWDFPYEIIAVIRVLPESYARKTRRRFDKKEQFLSLDFSIIYEQYQRLSKLEQREALGNLLFEYMSESLAKYKQYAEKEIQAEYLTKIKNWMLENDWLHGKIEQARELLAKDTGLYEVSQQLKLPIEEVEYIYACMYGSEPDEIHPDNIRAGKAPIYN